MSLRVHAGAILQHQERFRASLREGFEHGDLIRAVCGCCARKLGQALRRYWATAIGIAKLLRLFGTQDWRQAADHCKLRHAGLVDEALQLLLVGSFGHLKLLKKAKAAEVRNDGRQAALQITEALGRRCAVVLRRKTVRPRLLGGFVAMDVIHLVDAEVALDQFYLVDILGAVLNNQTPKIQTVGTPLRLDIIILHVQLLDFHPGTR